MSAPPASVYLAVRRPHPELVAERLRKRVLVPLTHALEDQVVSRSRRPLLFGGFQREPFLSPALPRWRQLARRARSTIVFVEGPGVEVPLPGVRRVELAADAPLRQEWAVVCDDADFGMVISAWEIPGQGTAPDADRVFEVVWSLEAAPVRAAARACARLAHSAGVPDAELLVSELAGPAPAGPDVRTVSDVFATVLRRVGEAASRAGD